MQLPRGRFDRFVRDETVLGIIKELGETGYSGSCSGIFGDSAAELIFEEGKIVLAESAGKAGSDALKEIHSNSDGIVTAELSLYNEAQLKLAREFNRGCLIEQEFFDSLFSGLNDKDQSEGEYSEGPADKIAAAGKGPEDPDMSELDEINLDESEIQSIITNFRSGAKDLLKKINLDHLVVEDKSGEDGKR